MLTGNTLVFDIETVPDTVTGSRIWGLMGIEDDDQVKAMRAKRLEKTGYTDFIAHHLHKIVAISAALRSSDGFKIWSIGDAGSSERELLERFFRGIEKFEPVLVSWNGGGFDLPVIHYRSLLHSVEAPHYWEVGDTNRAYRYNNFINPIVFFTCKCRLYHFNFYKNFSYWNSTKLTQIIIIVIF